MKNLLVIAISVLILSSCIIIPKEEMVAACVERELRERSILGPSPSVDAIVKYCQSIYAAWED